MWCDEQFQKHNERIALDKGRQDRIDSAVRAFETYCNQDAELERAMRGLKPFLQGSVLTGTAVRPLGRDEYDVDVIYPFGLATFPNGSDLARFVFRWFTERIATIAAYKGRTEIKNRCVRIHYVGDFHVDVIPSTKEVPAHQPWAVPTRGLDGWVTNDPAGFAEWVKGHDLASGLVDANGDGVFLRCVRYMKRWRDHFFGTNPAPSSILLVSILGRHQVTAGYDPPLDGPLFPTCKHDAAYLFDLLRLTCSCIRDGRSEAFLHPTIVGEDLRRDWDTKFHQQFLDRLVATFNALKRAIDATTTADATKEYKAALGESFPGG